MPDLARRLVELLREARIPAEVASRPGVELVPEGDPVASTAWDVRVGPREADRARRVIARARHLRRLSPC
jgi:hypothetical protein